MKKRGSQAREERDERAEERAREGGMRGKRRKRGMEREKKSKGKEKVNGIGSRERVRWGQEISERTRGNERQKREI